MNGKYRGDRLMAHRRASEQVTSEKQRGLARPERCAGEMHSCTRSEEEGSWWVMWLKAIANAGDRRRSSRWRSVQPGREHRPACPRCGSVLNAVRLRRTGLVRRRKAPMFWKTGRPPGLSRVRAALYSDPGRRASRHDLLERVAAPVPVDDGLAAAGSPRKHRLLADEAAVPRLEREPKLADRGLDVDEFGDVWGERGGNEIPQSGSYAGLR
jgi:hypothetical protein